MLLFQRFDRLRTPILIPSRIPSHWPDAEYLEEVGYRSLNSKAQNKVMFECCGSDEVHASSDEYECVKV